MERLPLIAIPLALAMAGCSAGSQAQVTAEEENMYKHPEAVDRSKIPADVFKTRGPAFIGKPTGATNPSGATPPAAATRG